jgi:hypothetical protein
LYVLPRWRSSVRGSGQEAGVLPSEELVKKEVREIEFFPAATTRDTVLDESKIVALAGCGGCCLDDDELGSVVGQICS